MLGLPDELARRHPPGFLHVEIGPVVPIGTGWDNAVAFAVNREPVEHLPIELRPKSAFPDLRLPIGSSVRKDRVGVNALLSAPNRVPDL